MKRLFTLTILSLLSLFGSAQNFTGQWKGGFMDNSSGFVGFGGEKIEYVLELEMDGNKVFGYSYTYFIEGGKRYYTICKLKGQVNKSTKEVIVTEYERTKFNTPRDFRNCFQTHRLTYYKSGEDSESLEGNWVPAPDQDGDCGFGKTYLTRRLLKKTVPFNSKTTAKTPVTRDNPYRESKEKKTEPVAKTTPAPKLNKPVTPPVVKNKTETKKTTTTTTEKPLAKTEKQPVKEEKVVKEEKTTPINDIASKDNDKLKQIETSKIAIPSDKFEKRANKVLKTIEVEKDKITVDLYDNGEIDGDTVSVFYNGKLLVSNKRLSTKPITLTLELDEDLESNELTMYAENLGEIPPNTALMVVRDGDKRYEVRIISDTQKNGTIAFVHKKN